MKKLLLLAVGLFFFAQSNAQSPYFGVTAGYLNAYDNMSQGGIDVSASYSGYYLGVFADVDLSESFMLQPGINFGQVEETVSFLFIPFMVKYYIGGSGFNLQAGPQATINLEKVIDGYNRLGIDGSFGAGYDITDEFILQARYSLELTNRVGSMQGVPDDLKSRVNSLTIGLGYRF